jgi:hypothetical protein
MARNPVKVRRLTGVRGSASLEAVSRRIAAGLVGADSAVRAEDSLVTATPKVTVTDDLLVFRQSRVNAHALGPKESTSRADFDNFEQALQRVAIRE